MGGGIFVGILCLILEFKISSENFSAETHLSNQLQDEVLVPGLQQELLRVARSPQSPEEVPPQHQQEHQAERPSHLSDPGQHK
jgi:hypothetical protein